MMSTAGVSFVVSSVGIVGMISLKLIELRRGKPLASRFFDRTNHIVHSGYLKVRRYASYVNKRNAVLFSHYVIAHVIVFGKRFYGGFRDKVENHPRTKRYIDMISGKGAIKRKGSVSFFLQRIREEEIPEISKIAEPANVAVVSPVEEQKN